MSSALFYTNFSNLLTRKINYFDGAHIKAVSIVEAPFVEECVFDQDYVPRGEHYCKHPGIDLDLLLFIAQVLNFTLSFTRVYTAEDEFDMLRRNYSDMTISPRVSTNQRVKSARFTTIPLDEINYKILIKMPSRTQVHMKFLMSPFGLNFWIVMVVTGTLLLSIYVVCSFLEQFFQLYQSYARRRRCSYDVHRTEFNAPHPRAHWFISCTGQRLMLLVCGYSATMLLAFYPNVLTLALSYKMAPKLPFSDIYGLAEALLEKKFRLIIPFRGTGLWHSIICPDDTGDHSFYLNMHTACREHPPLIEPNETQLMEYLLEDDTLATIVSEPKLETLEPRYSGKYLTIDSGLPNRFRFYWFRKGTEYQIPLWLMEFLPAKYNLILKEYVEIERRAVMREEAERDDNDLLIGERPPPEKIKPLSLYQVQEAFWLIFGGGAAAMVFLILERLIHHYFFHSTASKSSNFIMSSSTTVNFLGYRKTQSVLQHSSSRQQRENSSTQAFLQEAAAVAYIAGRKLSRKFTQKKPPLRKTGRINIQMQNIVQQQHFVAANTEMELQRPFQQKESQHAPCRRLSF